MNSKRAAERGEPNDYMVSDKMKSTFTFEVDVFSIGRWWFFFRFFVFLLLSIHACAICLRSQCLDDDGCPDGAPNGRLVCEKRMTYDR